VLPETGKQWGGCKPTRKQLLQAAARLGYEAPPDTYWRDEPPTHDEASRVPGTSLASPMKDACRGNPAFPIGRQFHCSYGSRVCDAAVEGADDGKGRSLLGRFASFFRLMLLVQRKRICVAGGAERTAQYTRWGQYPPKCTAAIRSVWSCVARHLTVEEQDRCYHLAAASTSEQSGIKQSFEPPV